MGKITCYEREREEVIRGESHGPVRPGRLEERQRGRRLRDTTRPSQRVRRAPRAQPGTRGGAVVPVPGRRRQRRLARGGPLLGNLRRNACGLRHRRGQRAAAAEDARRRKAEAERHRREPQQGYTGRGGFRHGRHDYVHAGAGDSDVQTSACRPSAQPLREEEEGQDQREDEGPATTRTQLQQQNGQGVDAGRGDPVPQVAAAAAAGADDVDDGRRHGASAGERRPPVHALGSLYES